MTTATLPALVQQFFTDRLCIQMEAAPGGEIRCGQQLIHFRAVQELHRPPHIGACPA
jgi:hypothetical protein